MREIKVGVVGCGSNCENHLRVYARTPGIRLVAVCDSIEGRARQMALKFGAKQTLTDFRAMLNLDLDLVDVITQVGSHSTLAKQALESGCNVLVEKPMALSARECQEMISASMKSGRMLCVNHNKRFYAGVVQARDYIDQEKLKVSRMHLADFFIYSRMRPKWTFSDDSGGLLFESMVHHAYLLEYFLGRIERAQAVARRVGHPMLDSLTLLVDAQGPVGISEFEWDSKVPLFGFQVFTEEGIRIDGDLFGDFALRWPSPRTHSLPRTVRKVSDELAVPIQRLRTYLRLNTGLPFYGRISPYKRTFYTIIRKYLASIANNETVPPVSPEEGLRSIEVLEAASKSIRTERLETVEHSRP